MDRNHDLVSFLSFKNMLLQSISSQCSEIYLDIRITYRVVMNTVKRSNYDNLWENNIKTAYIVNIDTFFRRKVI